jgi:hypothetical protein
MSKKEELTPEAYDMISKVKSLRNCQIKPVVFDNARWATFVWPSGCRCKWTEVPFKETSISTVPADKHGVYSFSIVPGIARHPQNALLIYIGKADCMTLQERFISYFYERRRAKRLPLCEWLWDYRDYIVFSFCSISDVATIDVLESNLNSTLLPPANTEYDGVTGTLMKGAFK